MQEQLKPIFERRSVRDFTGEALSQEQLHTLLAAAMQAPSCRNKRKDCYLVLTNREEMCKILQVHPYASMLKSAGAAVIVCGEPIGGAENDYWVEDASACMENLLLAAQGLGLGAVWLGVYPLQDRVEGLRGLFHIPEGVTPMGIAAVGVPASTPEPIDRFREDKVHWERW